MQRGLWVWLSVVLAVAAVACAQGTTANSADAGSDAIPAACSPLDGKLRINHVQMLGTHNSYHVAKDKPVSTLLAYTHDPLDVQLNQQGVRAFEFDLHHQGTDKPIAVLHIQGLDELTRCPTLVNCLQQLKDWSDKHPCHHPIVVTLENKDDLEQSHVADHLDQFDAEVLSVLPKERLVRPDDLRGQEATLAAAVSKGQWPTLGESRGKFLLVLYNNKDLLEHYRTLHPGMAGATAFVFGKVGDPDVAAVLMDNPTNPDIAATVTKGYLVRTFPEPTAAEGEAAAASGATVVSTDNPVAKARLPNYWFQLPGGAPSRCNPLTAPSFCTAAVINAGVGAAIPGP